MSGRRTDQLAIVTARTNAKRASARKSERSRSAATRSFRARLARPGFGVVFLAVLLGAGACVTDKVTGERQFSLVNWTVEQELAIGKEAAPNIESQFESICLDLEAQEYLGERVRELVSRSPRRNELDFHFKILNSSVPNAFALPGGFTYITRGLLAQLESEAQFVSIMGHELGHVEHRHAMDNQSKQRVVGILTLPLRPFEFVGDQLPVGSRVVSFATGIATAPATLYLTSHSRAQETEADERGVTFAVEMGFDPRDAALTFELFDRLESLSDVDDTPSWLRTHPMNDDRAKDIQDFIAERYPSVLKEGAQFRSSTPEFDQIRDRFRARAPAYAAYDLAVALVAEEEPDWERVGDLLVGALNAVPEEPLFHIAAGEIALIQEDSETALYAFLHALELYGRFDGDRPADSDPDHTTWPGESHWKVHFYLGILQLEVSAARAAEQFRLACERFPMHAVSWFLLGQALEQTSEFSQAIEAYEHVLELTDSSLELHEQAQARVREIDTE